MPASILLVLLGCLVALRDFVSPLGADPLTNRGKKFIIAFMENEVWGHNEVKTPQLLLSTSARSANVRITTPLMEPNFKLMATASAQTFTRVDLLAELVVKGTGVQQKGVLVEADAEIQLVPFNQQVWSSEGFLALPLHLLGTEYFAVTWTSQSQLMVVGTEDGTSVTVTLPATGANLTFHGTVFQAGDELTLELQAFETLQLQAPEGDLTGARVRASKPVAVLSGATKVDVDGKVGGQAKGQASGAEPRNHLVEQLLPVPFWGDRYVVATDPGRLIGGVVRVVASLDNTTVSMGNQSHTLARAGDFVQLDLPDDVQLVQTLTADKPVQVALFERSPQASKDMPFRSSMVILIPTASFLDSLVVLPQPDMDTNMVVIAPADFVNSLDYSDSPLLPGAWRSVQVSPSLLAQSLVGSSRAVHLRQASGSASLMAYVFGHSSMGSLAHPTGLRVAYSQVCKPSQGQAGDGVDNDCDGFTDEEQDNNLDDDGDGKVDEDLRYPPVQCGLFECHRHASCKDGQCQCDPPYQGEGRFTCSRPRDGCHCTTFGDPHAVDYNSEGLELPLLCRFALTRIALPDCRVNVYMRGRPFGSNSLSVMMETVYWDYGQEEVAALSGYSNSSGVFFSDHSKVPFNTRRTVGNLVVDFRVDETGFYSMTSSCGVELRYRAPVVTVRRPKPVHQKVNPLEDTICGLCSPENVTASTWEKRAVRVLSSIAPASSNDSVLDIACNKMATTMKACTAELREEATKVCSALLVSDDVFSRCGMPVDSLHALLAACLEGVCNSDTDVHRLMQEATARCSGTV